MEADLKIAIFLVAVNLISNSLQISSVSDTSHKHVTYGHNEKGTIAHNPEISQNTDYSSLPQLYRDALLKLNGTNYQELIKNIGSGGKSVKITFKRKVKGSHKNYAKTTHVSGYKSTDNSDPQNRETYFEGESFIAKEHPKLMAAHHKNYITSVKFKKHAHKMLPQDMTSSRFQKIYYDGNKNSADRNKGDNYHAKYIIKNNHIKKAPDMSQYFVDDSFPDTKYSGRSSIHHIKPKSERSYSRHNVPSINRTVKFTKHIMKTNAKIPVNKLKEADNGDINEIYDYSEEPMENISIENENYEKPPSDEWVYEDIAAEKSSNGNENSKDIPIDNIFYQGLVEAGDHEAKDLISEHKYPKVPAPSVKPPQEYQDVIFGDTSSTKDKDQEVVLKDASSAQVKILENNPSNVIVLENDPYPVFVEDNIFLNGNPEYIIADDVISEDINSKEKPIDVVSKELSYNDQIPAEISSEVPKVFNVTPNNIGSENDIVNIVPSKNLSNQGQQSSEDVSDEVDSEENTSSNTIKGIENIPKIKNKKSNNDVVNIFDEHPDASVKNIIWNRRPGKTIVYKKTSHHNVTKENIKLINYLRRKQKTSAFKGERSGTATPVKIILDSRENAFLPDDFGENDSLKNANYDNNDYNDLIPDVINVPYTKKSPDPWLDKLETINKFVCHICGTAKRLLHRKPDTFLINRMKQIFYELKILNSHLKDYVPKDSDSIEGGENETPNIDLYSEDNNELYPEDIKKPIAVPIPDYETWEKGKQKNPTGDVKNNLALILKLLQRLKNDAQEDKTIGDDPNESNKDLGNNLPVPLLKYWYNYLDGKTPKSNKDYNDSLLDPLIETIKNNPEVSPRVHLKWYVKMNLRKILPVLQQNIITIRKIKNLIELLYKEFESTGKKDCQTDTYKKILKNIYNFLEFIMKLSENRRN